MHIITGLVEGKNVLARQPSAEFSETSPALNARIKNVFGRDLTPEQAVREIIDDVKAKGDSALFEYSRMIDGVKLSSLEVSKAQIKAAYKEVDAELVDALKVAAKRIRDFHVVQKHKFTGSWVRRSSSGKQSLSLDGRGVGEGEKSSGWLVRPLARVGLYVPGGTARYPSTVLMTAVPARVAGVKEVVLTTPPGRDGKVPAATLVAADIAGVDRVFALGGAQAIAALAYGTDTVPRVDKICGPGNIFVVLAKRSVYGVVDIDSLPGPSEVLIIGDDTTDAGFCASELLAQAEHDAMATSIMVTPSRKLADAVNKELTKQMADLSRSAIAKESLDAKGLIVVVENMDEAIELANLYAPEHLCLLMDNAADYIERIENAGCIIAGKYATVAYTDYVAGPSHVLPTGGTARFGSPLNISDFLKIIDVVQVDKSDLQKLGKAVATIARAEGLDAHAKAVERRLK